MENIDNNETESMPIIDDEVIQNTAEEAEFLKSLDGDAENGDQTIELDKTLLLEQGRQSAVGVLAIVECLGKQFGHTDFAIKQDYKEQVTDSFAPLFVKYGGELPPWLLQYKEEMAFTLAFGALCFTSYAQINALKKEDALIVAKKNATKKATVDATNQPE